MSYRELAKPEYYSQHSLISHPGKFEYLFSALPNTVAELAAIVKNLVFHPVDSKLYNYYVSKNAYAEMNARFMHAMLAILLTKGIASLLVKRNFTERMVGVCRDNALLLCSMLRAKKIPARLRVGFVNFLQNNFYQDGVCVQYWHQQQQRWCLLDVRLTPLHCCYYKIPQSINLSDLSTHEFISPARAWQWCRQANMNPNSFGSMLHNGLWCIRNRMLHDLAFLLKKEVLLWDLWGMMLKTVERWQCISVDDLLRLDELSYVLLNLTDNVSELHHYYDTNPYLHLTKRMTVANPFQVPYEVKLQC